MRKKKSQVVIWILVLIIIALAVALFYKKSPESKKDITPVKQVQSTPIVITEKDIKEENFKGTVSSVKGDSALAKESQAYIDETVESFRQSANTEVPDMRAKFGADSPTSNYEIDIKATYFKAQNTESIIIDQYVYTGGANGNDSYKVFTASLANGKILKLSDIIKSSEQGAFTKYVKDKLMAWRPEGGKEVVVFPDEVASLSFDSFTNWSLAKNNLIIYFDKYAVGPGVLGAIAFQLPFSQTRTFFNQGY